MAFCFICLLLELSRSHGRCLFQTLASWLTVFALKLLLSDFVWLSPRDDPPPPHSQTNLIAFTGLYMVVLLSHHAGHVTADLIPHGAVRWLHIGSLVIVLHHYGFPSPRSGREVVGEAEVLVFHGSHSEFTSSQWSQGTDFHFPIALVNFTRCLMFIQLSWWFQLVLTTSPSELQKHHIFPS